MASDLNDKLMNNEANNNVEEDCVNWGSDDGEVLPVTAGKVFSSNGTTPEGEKPDNSLCIAVCSLVAAIPALIGSWCWPILVGALFAVAASNVNGGLVDFFHGVQVAIMLALMTNIVQFAYWNVQKKRKTMEVDGTTHKATHWYQYRPVYTLMVAMVLVCTQPVCMLVIGSWRCKGHYTSSQLTLGSGPGSVNWNATAGCFTSDKKCVGKYSAGGDFEPWAGTTAAEASKFVANDMGVGFPSGCSESMQNFFFDGTSNTNALVPNTTTGWMIQIFCTYLGFLLMFVGVCQATMLHIKIMKKWTALRGGSNGA